MRLDQISALRSLGIPLKSIRNLLDAQPQPLAEALRRQRAALEARRTELDGAIRALDEAGRMLEAGEQIPAVLDKIREGTGMESIDAMQRYFDDASWEKRKSHYGNWPTPAWRDLYRRVERVLHEDPRGAIPQALAEEWRSLVGRDLGWAFGVLWGEVKAWADRANWPASLKRRLAGIPLEQIYEFMGAALGVYPEKLIERTEAAMASGPAGGEAQTIAREWMALGRLSVDAAVHLGFIRACYAYRGSGRSLEKVLDFVGLAVAWPLSQFFPDGAWLRFAKLRQESAPTLADDGIRQGLQNASAARGHWDEELAERVASPLMRRYSIALDESVRP